MCQPPPSALQPGYRLIDSSRATSGSLDRSLQLRGDRQLLSLPQQTQRNLDQAEWRSGMEGCRRGGGTDEEIKHVVRRLDTGAGAGTPRREEKEIE